MKLPIIAPDKCAYSQNYFSYFAIKKYAVGNHWKCLNKALLMGTHTYILAFGSKKGFYLDQLLYTSVKLKIVSSFFSFVCAEVLRPSQPNRIMLSAISLPNHTFTGQDTVA